MDDGGPAGGVWNLDRDNRSSFGRHGPDAVPPPERFPPNPVTNAVIETVRARFPDHPGRLEDFDLPVTRGQARRALDEFIEHRLPGFGTWQDAMWNGESLLHHSRLSAPLNLHLLRPRECVDAAEQAYRSGRAALNDVEGFIRQILGWREFVRGVYWAHMPEYANGNALDHHEPLPDFYWSGATDMACFADAMTNVLDHGYAHHIQRLMVLGLFALLYGVEPYRFHEWHMAMYVDAVDWVSLPNTLGMSQFGDGGVVGTKPYCASGAYIKRMSNYCSSCRYDPGAATGASACPFTTLYWDFLDRHAQRFAGNRRMTFQLRNLDRRRQRPGEMESIRAQARRLRESHNDGH
jgi:deoxyribodipyrimidine photolyase-related protein